MLSSWIRLQFLLLCLDHFTFRDGSTKSMVLRTANTLNIRSSTKEAISSDNRKFFFPLQYELKIQSRILLVLYFPTVTENGSENKILSELTTKKNHYDFYHVIKYTHFYLEKKIIKMFPQANSNTSGKSEKCICFHMYHLSIALTTAASAGWC